MGLDASGVVNEFPGEIELAVELFSECSDAEGFGEVMAGVNEVDAEFFGEGIGPMGAFAGDEGIDAFAGNCSEF